MVYDLICYGNNTWRSRMLEDVLFNLLEIGINVDMSKIECYKRERPEDADKTLEKVKKNRLISDLEKELLFLKIRKDIIVNDVVKTEKAITEKEVEIKAIIASL